METDKSMMTQFGHSSSCLRELDVSEIKRLKILLLSMLDDIDKLCKMNGLTPLLVGGSALGAVRHKGFIPWDDDLDIGMKRQDYDQFIRLLENGELGNEYEYTYPNDKKESKNLFLKIYKKNTLCVEITDLKSTFPKGVYIDVFPIENVPHNKIARKIKGFISNIWAFSAISVHLFRFSTNEYREFMSQTVSGRKRLLLRMTIGLIGSIISYKKWCYYFDKFVQHKNDSGYLTIPTGRKHYNGEVMPYNVFFPPRIAEFEGRNIYIPNDYNYYLKKLYGDYLTIPPLSKRERHFVVELSI